MKKPVDLTLEVLKSIRDEVKKTNTRLDATNTRLDALSDDVKELRDELGRRIVESELCTATAITELAGTVRELTTILRAQGELRPRVEKCEQEIAEIKRQLPRAS